MTKRDRSRPGRDRPDASGAGGFLGQVGLFESANGLPHAPLAVVLAIAAAVVIYPLARLARMIARR